MSGILWHLANIAGVLGVLLTLAGALIMVERRLLALWQDRYGPNRVGPFGLLQVAADMIKIFTKEDWIPPFSDKPPSIDRGRFGGCNSTSRVAARRSAGHRSRGLRCWFVWLPSGVRWGVP